ncbi:hypothetical protein [Terrilactibacillus tamarindi]|nr:hypothetical protein [Terrilactibacillus tamarindi]
MLTAMVLSFCIVYGMVTAKQGVTTKEIKVPENQRPINLDLTIPTTLPTSTQNANGESVTDRMKQLEKKEGNQSPHLGDHLSNSISTVTKKGMNVASSTVHLFSQLFL